jgi:hypothetical protein
MLHCLHGNLSTVRCSSLLAYFIQLSLFLLRKRDGLSSIAVTIFPQTIIASDLSLYLFILFFGILNKSLKRIKEQNAVPPPLHHVGGV